MSLFNNAVIIGTGLIGSSLGVGLKKKRLVRLVTGFSRHKENARLAKKLGAIDIAGSSLSEINEADLVILAMPPAAIISTAVKIAGRIKKGCIVIDVGSTKEEIVSRASRYIPNFIGCHPLCGSEKRGSANLVPGLFRGSVCVVTPSPKTDKCLLGKVCSLWERLGSRVFVLSPGEHDRILAFTSHLPHAVAFSLIRAVPESFMGLSSGGLRDITRISSSDAALWSEIFLSNRGNLLRSISAFQAKLSELKLAIKNKDKKLLTGMLSAAKKKREKI
jgi:prephenate dehydrogenase